MFLRYYSFREAHTPVVGEDGALYFVSDISGKPEIWFIPKDHPFPVQLTFLDGYVSVVKRWGRGLLFQFDPNGSEEHRLMCVGDGGDILPLSGEQGRGVIYRLGGASADVFSYASNKRSAPFFDSYVNIGGREELVFEYDGTTQPHELSGDMRWLLVSVSITSLNNDVYVVDLEKKASRKLFEHTDEALTVEPTWGPDGLVYACTNMGDEFMQPVAVDPSTGRVSWLSRGKWDAEHIAVSDKGLIAYTRNKGGLLGAPPSGLHAQGGVFKGVRRHNLRAGFRPRRALLHVFGLGYEHQHPRPRHIITLSEAGHECLKRIPRRSGEAEPRSLRLIRRPQDTHVRVHPGRRTWQQW